MLVTQVAGAALAEYGRPAVAVSILLLAGYLLTSYFQQLLLYYRVSKFPLIGADIGSKEERKNAWIKDSRRFYAEGYEKYKDGVYRVTTKDANRITVVIPYTDLDALKRLPNDHLNLNREVHERTESMHTGMDRVDKDFMIHMIRSDLTKNLNRINPVLAAGAKSIVSDELGACDGWTETVIFPKMLKIVAVLSGQVFVGPEIAQKEEYYTNTVTAVNDFFLAVNAVKRWPQFLKPYVKYFSSEVKGLQRHLAVHRALITPTIKARKEARSRGEKIPDDLITWMMDKAPEWPGQSEEVQAEVQFELSAVTIFTTTAMIVAALFELAIRPELVDEIRAEVRSVLEANGGEMTPSALYQMRLTDSFLRETARVNPQAPARFQRYVEKPIVLKSGVEIPAGVYIEAPAEPVLFDPSVFPDPEVFDARRFLKLREGTGEDRIGYQNKELYQFVTSTKENLAFGFGPHVCPGRFWAANAIKLMLARIVTHYDIRMPGGSMEKGKLISAGLHVQPDPATKVEIRARTPVGMEANA